jgi:hypothetical protein
MKRIWTHKDYIHEQIKYANGGNSDNKTPLQNVMAPNFPTDLDNISHYLGDFEG